jgi:hypothetical protein
MEMANKGMDKTFCRNFQMYVNENFKGLNRKFAEGVDMCVSDECVCFPFSSSSNPVSRGLLDEIPVDSSCECVEKVFKTRVRQSPPGSNEQVQGSCGRNNLIKISKLNSWYYYTPRTENFNNYYCGERYRKPPPNTFNQRSFKDIRHNLLSWKDKTRLKMKDKIRKGLLEEKLPKKEFIKELEERKILLDNILKERDFLTRREETRTVRRSFENEYKLMETIEGFNVSISGNSSQIYQQGQKYSRA